MSQQLLPRARFRDVVRGRAPLVGARLDTKARRGWVSPIEARIHLGIPYGDLATEEARLLEGPRRSSDLAVLIRVGLAQVAAPSRAAVSIRSPWVVSSRVDNISIEEALDGIFAPRLAARARMIHFVHPHALNLAYADRELAQRLARADLILPDGIGIRIAARMLGVEIRHNINGSDLWPLLVRRAARDKVRLALVGAAPGIAESCAKRLMNEKPGLDVAVVSHGYLDDEESRQVASRIRELHCSLVLVGMGTPRQEAWAWTHLADLRHVTVLTVGALFDFVSGETPRAPHTWRELGLEWLYRMLGEPRRLGKRYLVGNPLFLMRTVRQRLRTGRRSAGR